jgi:hypothetical protein
MLLDFIFQFALGAVVTEREKLRLVDEIGVIMDTTEDLTMEEREQAIARGVTFNINASGDKRIAVHDYIEVHIHCGDRCPLTETPAGSGAGAAA